MKTGYVRDTLQPNNLKEVTQCFLDPKRAGEYAGLTAAIADAMDYAIATGDCWVSIGVTRDKGAIILTVHFAHSKLTAAGPDLAQLSKAAADLL